MKITNALSLVLLFFSSAIFAEGSTSIDSAIVVPYVESKSFSASSIIDNSTMTPLEFKAAVAGKSYRIFKPAFVFEQACQFRINDRGVKYCRLPPGVNQVDITIDFSADGSNAVMNGYYYYIGAYTSGDYYNFSYSDLAKSTDMSTYNSSGPYYSTASAARFDSSTGYSPRIVFNNRLLRFRDPLPISAYVAPDSDQGYYSWHLQEMAASYNTPSLYQSTILDRCGTSSPARVDNILCPSGDYAHGEDLNVVDLSTVELKIYGVGGSDSMKLLGRLR